jgi:ergothioneine biosynthesis protein EgtB
MRSDLSADSDFAARYRDVRAATLRLCDPLSPEDCTPQSMPDASPVKWHLAHTTWFFETFVLERADAGYAPVDPAYRVLFNSYYNAVGEQYSRSRRGLVTRPTLAEVGDYRRRVDDALVEWLESGAATRELRAVVEIGLHHEQQHQELILTDLKHLLSHNPLHPVYRPGCADSDHVSALSWSRYDEGLYEIGHAGPGFAFDNEGPRHPEHLGAFELASRLVTAGDFTEFIDDGGYQTPELWLSDGWAHLQQHALEAPLYWERADGGWEHYTLGGRREVRTAEPVTHVSLYEADAYARWAGARLPTEFEWEVAAADAPVKGTFVESERFHPAPLDEGAVSDGPAQLFGDVWEWTGSAYLPYPGYSPPAGAIGEYNGKFMVNQHVLRGGSCATPNGHVRATYRNFFPADARWQFSGIRLARDAI